MNISVTGHRPTKLGGYGSIAHYNLVAIMCDYIDRLDKPTRDELIIYTGMALGWDTAVAHACAIRSVKFIACIPFKGQESMWPKESQDTYNTLLTSAYKIVVVSEGGYSAAKMQIRNQYMVDNTESVIAMWDGSPGGTANCITYAAANKKRTLNLINQYLLSLKT